MQKLKKGEWSAALDRWRTTADVVEKMFGEAPFFERIP
jgi:hypothetical protein